MPNQLDQLKTMTTVVADTGDFESISAYKPQDATTNPSLILKAVQDEKYLQLAKETVAWAKQKADGDDMITLAVDKLSVVFGSKLMQVVPGVVSTEVDARLSFDIDAMVSKARQIIKLYDELGADSSRVLIKLAASWEGIQAAKILEADGIKTNITLLFAFAQARAAAEVNAYLISPFVGRILDWHKANDATQDYSGANDPGVQSVTKIFDYFKTHNYKTIVMGASFRNISEIQELAGCDRLTISPGLLDELANNNEPLPQKLIATTEHATPPAALTEAEFRWQLNEDRMATEKLSDGIRAFARDQEKLEKLLAEL